VKENGNAGGRLTDESERVFEGDKSVVPFTLGRVPVTTVVCRLCPEINVIHIDNFSLYGQGHIRKQQGQHRGDFNPKMVG
jgi:hypothetical protein